jgi:hypothetical protein
LIVDVVSLIADGVSLIAYGSLRLGNVNSFDVDVGSRTVGGSAPSGSLVARDDRRFAICDSLPATCALLSADCHRLPNIRASRIKNSLVNFSYASAPRE